MRIPLVVAVLTALCGATPAVAAPAVAHIDLVQDAVTVGDKARYVARAQRCKDEFFKELRLADGRVPGSKEALSAAPPNPMVKTVLDEGGLPAAQILASAINVCLAAQGLPGVRAVLSAEPLPLAPLE